MVLRKHLTYFYKCVYLSPRVFDNLKIYCSSKEMLLKTYLGEHRLLQRIANDSPDNQVNSGSADRAFI